MSSGWPVSDRKPLLYLYLYITTDAMKHVVAAVILGRLDYCNSVLACLPWSTVAPLQRVQNAAARLVVSLSPRDHVSPAFVELHRLSIHYTAASSNSPFWCTWHISASHQHRSSTPSRQSVNNLHAIIYALLPLLILSYHQEEEQRLSREKKRSETQTLRAGCSKAEAKNFRPAADPLPGGAGRPKFNQLEMVTTFTYKPSLVRIDAPNFELSW